MQADIFDNQFCVLEFDPVDAGGNPSTCTGEAFSTDQALIVKLTPVPNQPTQVRVDALGKVGQANVVANGTNETGGTISGPPVVVNVKATPAVGFQAKVITIANQ